MPGDAGLRAADAQIERQIAAMGEAHDKQYRGWFNAQPGLDPRSRLHPRVDVQPYLERIAALEVEVKRLRGDRDGAAGGEETGDGR